MFYHQVKDATEPIRDLVLFYHQVMDATEPLRGLDQSLSGFDTLNIRIGIDAITDIIVYTATHGLPPAGEGNAASIFDNAVRTAVNQAAGGPL